jgi:hypothetical protein
VPGCGEERKGVLEMDQKTMVKQAFDFQKAALDNVYRNLVAIQDQTEKSISQFLDRMPWMPEGSRQIIIRWGNMYKKSRDDFKKVMDDGYDKMESYLISAAEATQRASSQAQEAGQRAAQQARQTTRRTSQQTSRTATKARKAAAKSTGKS